MLPCFVSQCGMHSCAMGLLYLPLQSSLDFWRAKHLICTVAQCVHNTAMEAIYHVFEICRLKHFLMATTLSCVFCSFNVKILHGVIILICCNVIGGMYIA